MDRISSLTDSSVQLDWHVTGKEKGGALDPVSAALACHPVQARDLVSSS